MDVDPTSEEGLAGATEQLLTTTRSVRRGLDLSRPVDLTVVEDCLRIAVQAPNGGNLQAWRFLVITSEPTRAALAEVYRRAFARYREEVLPGIRPGAADEAGRRRTLESAEHLAATLHLVPVHVIPCQLRAPLRPLDAPEQYRQASFYASIYPAVWSFQLALRSRGLASTLTTLHLMYADEIASRLRIPRRVVQCALLPVAHLRGAPPTTPALRRPLHEVVYRETWGLR